MTLRWNRSLAGATVVLAVSVSACSGGPALRDSATLGDCIARVLWADQPYFPRGDGDRSPAGAKPLGSASIVGCEKDPTGERVTVFPVRGVAVDEAVVVVRGDYAGVFVREDLAPEDWSTALVELVPRPDPE